MSQEIVRNQLHKTKKDLSRCRQLNENITSKLFTIQEQCKELTTAPLNSNVLKDEDKYELAVISGERKFDSKFVTACLWILHNHDCNEILKLTVSNRTYVRMTEPLNKIEPKKLLLIKNLFCARARKNSGNPEEAESRIESLRKLLLSSLSIAKTKAKKKQNKS